MDPHDRIAELEQLVADLTAQLAAKDARIAAIERTLAAFVDRIGRNSGNSNLPPSSDPPGSRSGRKNKKQKDKRRRGGQPNHRGITRALLPLENVDDFRDFYPPQCENCCAPLPKTFDPLAKRFQMTELPAFEPHTTEYRRHGVCCSRCNHRTYAEYDAEAIPASPFGPRLMSVVALITGVYNMSRRRAMSLLSDLVGVRISLGAVSAVEARVSAAVETPVDEVWKSVVDADVKHTDGTTWLQSGIVMSLWTIATAVATVFKIVANGRAATIKPLYGELRGILVSDRATTLKFWSMERRQICWAHLLRKFVSFEERAGPAGAFGRELLDYTGIVFEYWDDYRTGRLSREVFRAWMMPLRAQVEALLERIVASGIAPLAGSCQDILMHRAALWNFVDLDAVEPTNNHAERELRAFVLWRKRSFGTQSERGNRFAERLMTIAHTARKQKMNVLEFLTACCVAHLDGGRAPSLLEQHQRAAA